MSKSSVASAPKLPTPLPQKSAWARGPPISSSPTPRSQSPAQASGSQPTTATHSRRPSTLGQAAVSFKDGVAGARSPVGATKPGASVTFGSIDDDSAPISSSPASVPPIKSEAIKTFGSVTAASTPVSAVNGKPSTSSSTSVSSTAKPPSSASHPKFDVKKLFQGSSSSASSQPSSESISSPSTRTTSLPQQSPPQASSSHAPQSAPYGNHSFQPFVPAGGLRPQPNGAGGNVPPRSPSSYRQVPNGTAPPVNGRPSGPGASGMPQTPMSAGMPSPRLGPPLPGQQAGMPPAPVWAPYQYYGYPPPPDWYAQQWMPMPPPQPPHVPGMQGPHQPPHQHQQPGMPMSPRHPPSNLHTPGTPTLSPAVTAPISTPSPHMHTSSLSTVTSPPSTPASSTGPGLAGGIMDRNAKPFVPGRKMNVTIKSPSGQEINVEAFKRHGASGSISGFPSPISAVPGSPARKVIRMESEDAKRERLAEEQRQKEKEESEKAKKEEAERIRKEKEEAERLRKVKEKEDEARRKKEEEEKERLRKADEEKERVRKADEEKRRLEEEHRLKEEQEKERLRKEEEEKERLRREEEEEREKERLRKEAEEKAKAEAEAEAAAAAAAAVAVASESVLKDAQKTEEPEEGEVDEKDDSKSHDKPPLRLDTAVVSPEPKRRPGPLDLSGTKGPIVPPLPSALATARIIDDLGGINYPEGIKSPKVELNINAKQGKFRYDRDFLLQFMAVCKDKPDNLPPLDAIGLEPSDQNFPITRGGSGRRQSASNMGPPSTNRSASIGLGISGFGSKPGSSGFTMGQFATVGGKMSSEERFAISNRSASMSSGPAGMPFGRPPAMVRTSSQGGPGGVPMGSNRTRSQRGGKRNDKNNTSGPSQSSAFGSSSQMMMSLEPVAPLEVSANRWTPGSLAKKPVPVNEDSPEVVERKVKSLLNKLTMERFDSISDQIIAWANRSEKEKDGRTLIQVIRLVFEKATDEAAWSEMYARLCRKMMEQISPKVQDDGIKNTDGRPITGGHLFRKYLLNRCQEDFERGWGAKESTAAAAVSKASQDQAAAKAAETAEEAALYSEEYYAASKAKRQGLGLIKFIGELFKLQMLTERIMHECVKKLLGNVENPEEEEIESLCQLLTTVGAQLDTPKARAHMDVYFSRMKELGKSPNVNSRMQFMLQDVTELRERKWIPRNQRIEPTTIAAVHEAAAKEKASQEKESYQRTLSMSRGGSRRGAERGDHAQIGPDGWAVAGNAAPRAPPKAGDLSNFGKITKNTSMTFGPGSVFAAGKTEKKRESATISRTGSVNMFSMLSQNPELANEVQAPSKSSRPPSRKPSIDLGAGGVPEAPMQRRKLALLPRSVPKDDEKAQDSPAPSTAVSDDEGAESSGPSMSVDAAKARVDEDSKEFFNVRDLGEAEVYFSKLPAEHRHILVDKLVTTAIDAKEADVTLVADLFARAAEKTWCPADAFEKGFAPTAEFLDDIVIDVPKAVTQFATMLKATGLDDERKRRIAEKSPESGAKLLSSLGL